MTARRRPVNSRSLAAAAALAVGLSAVSACSSVSNDAARVGDHSLATSDFEQVLADVGDVTESVLMPSGQFSAASARELLSGWITTQVLRDDLSARGIEVTDEDRAAVEEELTADPGWEAASPEVKRFFVEVNSVQEVFNRETGASDEELAEIYAGGPEASGIVCVRALVVTTEEEALAALARIEGGEAFGDVATELSLDQSTAAAGGVLSDPSTGLECLTWDAFSTGVIADIVTPIGPATAGELVGPIAIEGASVLVQVRPFDEVAETVRTMSGGTAALDAQAKLLLAAEPFVATRFGRWDRTTGAVVGLG